MTREYQWSDAWILLAVIYTGKEEPASLDAVIGAADYIQHAVVCFEEMEGALARLTAGDYVVEMDGRLAPSAKTLAFYRAVTTPRRPILKEQDDLAKWLNAVPWNSETSPNESNKGVSYPSLTREKFDAVVNEYQIQTRAIIDGMTKKKKKR